jgi:hypothetical protein
MRCPRCRGLMLVEARFEGREASCANCGHVAYLDGGLPRDMAAILDELESMPPATPGEEPVPVDEVSERRSASAGRGWATRRRTAPVRPVVSIEAAMARARGVA